MGFVAGLVGLPNAGKSTLFNALTGGQAEVGAYPFTTIGRNTAAVSVPDARLGRLARLTGSAKVTPPVLEVVDIAGLVRGAHRGEGLGNQFLAHIREVDIILHVLRCFDAPSVPHIYGSPDPVRDAETVEVELALADLGTVERRLERTRKKAKSGRTEDLEELRALEELGEALSRTGRPTDDGCLAPARLDARGRTAPAGVLRELFLLTSRPVVYVANLDDRSYAHVLAGAGPPEWLTLQAYAASRGSPAVPVSAAIEAEWAVLPISERDQWRDELGDVLKGGAGLIGAAFEHLGLITFYTINDNEARAHTAARGTLASQAAGKVHTDLERGFVRAEVVPAERLLEVGSMAAARGQGLVRVEGRDYIVEDGDILQVRYVPTS